MENKPMTFEQAKEQVAETKGFDDFNQYLRLSNSSILPYTEAATLWNQSLIDRIKELELEKDRFEELYEDYSVEVDELQCERTKNEARIKELEDAILEIDAQKYTTDLCLLEAISKAKQLLSNG
jgi:hypothetical protein